MCISILVRSLVLVLALTSVVAGAGRAVHQVDRELGQIDAPAATDEPQKQAALSNASQTEEEILKEMHAAATMEWDIRMKSAAGDMSNLETLFACSGRLLRADMEMADKDAPAKRKEARVAARQAHLDRIARVQKLVNDYSRAGLVGPWLVEEAKFYRSEAELRLLREKNLAAASANPTRRP
jgi:hypothetical protein